MRQLTLQKIPRSKVVLLFLCVALVTPFLIGSTNSSEWGSQDHPASDDTWCFGPGRTLYSGDYNGDGQMDLLCHNANTGRRRVDFANSSGTFYGTDWDSRRAPSASQDWCTNAGEVIYIGDFNGDSKDDLLCYNTNTGRRRIDFANSAGTFFGTDWNSESHRTASQNWCTNPGEVIYAGDFNGDSKDDLLCYNTNTARRRIDFANSAGTFFGTDWNSASHRTASQNWCTNPGEVIYVGDFNGDSRDDLLCYNTGTGRRRIDFANSAGTFFGTDWNSESYPDASQHWCRTSGETVYVGDFDGNGRDDLLCFGKGTARLRIDHANSAGTFLGTNWEETRAWCTGLDDHLSTGDFDGDGRSDLLCHNSSSGRRMIRFANDDGNFFGLCSSVSIMGDGTLEPIPVHFVVLADPARSPDIPSPTSTHTHPLTGATITGPEYFQADIDLINSAFVTDGGDSVCVRDDCIQFRYVSHIFFDEIQDSTCTDLLNVSNPPDWSWTETNEDISNKLAEAVNNCSDPALRHPGAVNFYIYDACQWDDSSGGPDWSRNIGHGRRNSGRPYVFVDYARMLNPNRQAARAAEEHELGHATGLARHTDIPADNTMGHGDRSAFYEWAHQVATEEDPAEWINQHVRLVEVARTHQRQWTCH